MKVKDVLKTESIIKAYPDDTIASVLSKLESSHDAAFVFDGDHYMGILNPYYSLIKHSSYNGNSLAKNVLFHPPRLSMDDDTERIIGLMVDSRLHYLPVLDENKFMGIVSARRVLEKISAMDIFDKPILDALQTKAKPLVTVYASDEISKIKHLFEEEDVSKLVVIDDRMKLTGIMSYYDLVPHLIAPSQRAEPSIKGNGEIDPFAGLTVKNVAKTLVHTLTPEATLRDCLMDIVKRSIGSVVIVNREGFPVGIITVRDLLHFLTRTEAEPMIELSTNDISPANMQILHAYGPKLERWIHKIHDTVRATMFVKEEKNGRLFKVTLSVIPQKGKATTYQVEGKNLLEVLQKINKN